MIASVAATVRIPRVISTPASAAAVGEGVPHVLGVVAHLQHPLALQHDQRWTAEHLEAQHLRALPIELREVALAERLHALAERLLRAGRQQQHAQPLDRLLAQPRRERDQRPHRAEVVVRARHHRAGADVRHHDGGTEGQRHPGAHHPPDSEHRPGAHEHRPEPRPVQDREGVTRALVLLGEHPRPDLAERRVEDEPRVGRIVVRNNHERSLRRASPPPPRPRSTSGDAGAVAGGTSGCRGRGRPTAPRRWYRRAPHRRASASVRVRAARAARRTPPAHSPARSATSRCRVRAPARPSPDSQLAEPVGDQLGRAMLPVGGGRPVERRELVDRVPPSSGAAAARQHLRTKSKSDAWRLAVGSEGWPAVGTTVSLQSATARCLRVALWSP